MVSMTTANSPWREPGALYSNRGPLSANPVEGGREDEQLLWSARPKDGERFPRDSTEALTTRATNLGGRREDVDASARLEACRLE